MKPSLPLTILPLAVLCLLASGVAARADDPPPAKPPGDTKPADPNKPDDKKPADPAKPGEGDKDKPKEEPPPAPAFKVKDLDGKERTLEEFKDKWLVLEWTNYGCPFVKKHYDGGHMQKLQKTYADKGVVWLTVCSTNTAHKDYLDAEAFKKAAAQKKVASTAILLDADGTMGHLYGAKTTPDLRVISPKGLIVYSGAIDDKPSAQANPAEAKNYVAEVLDAVLAGKPCPIASTKSYG